MIRVGAATETEMKYLKLKIEDAVNATKAAIEEGIVAGGGVALIRAGEKVKHHKVAEGEGMEIAVGYAIVIKALEAPLRQIAMNSGRDDGSVIVERVKNMKGNGGYNALHDRMEEDMVKIGIVDPVKVARTALENSASAAAILLTTEVAIADEPEDKKPDAGVGGMPGGMGY